MRRATELGKDLAKLEQGVFWRRNLACAHYVLVPELQRKPFWLATYLYQQ